MSLRKIFTLYTLGFLGVTILIGLAEWLFGLPNRWIGWIFMAPVTGYLHCHWHHYAHLEPGSVLRGRARCPGRLQWHGHRLGLDVSGVLHLYGRSNFRAGFWRPGVRYGLDWRLSVACRFSRTVFTPVWGLYDSGLPRRPLWRQSAAGHSACWRRSSAPSPISLLR